MILRKLDEYQKMLHEPFHLVGARPPRELPPEYRGKMVREIGDEITLRHLTWMCDHVRELVRSGYMEDAYRMLGFLEGWLFARDRAPLVPNLANTFVGKDE